MLLSFFDTLRRHEIPVSTRELLDCLGLLQSGLGRFSLDEFYQLSRISLVKDEKYYDRFDMAFADFFHGVRELESLIEIDAFERSILEVITAKSLHAEINKQVEARRDELGADTQRVDQDSECQEPPEGADQVSAEGQEGSGESGAEGEHGEQGERHALGAGRDQAVAESEHRGQAQDPVEDLLLEVVGHG